MTERKSMRLLRPVLFLALLTSVFPTFSTLKAGPIAAAPEITAPDFTGNGGKIRLLVLTDISSLTAGVREPDDGQSLIRLLLYSNDFEIEGFVATSNLIHGQTVRPDLIRQAVS